MIKVRSNKQTSPQIKLNTYLFVTYLKLVSDMLRSRQIPPDISLHLEDRTSNAGFFVKQVIMTSMAVNHENKAGELLW